MNKVPSSSFTNLMVEAYFGAPPADLEVLTSAEMDAWLKSKGFSKEKSIVVEDDECTKWLRELGWTDDHFFEDAGIDSTKIVWRKSDKPT